MLPPWCHQYICNKQATVGSSTMAMHHKYIHYMDVAGMLYVGSLNTGDRVQLAHRRITLPAVPSQFGRRRTNEGDKHPEAGWDLTVATLSASIRYTSYRNIVVD